MYDDPKDDSKNNIQLIDNWKEFLITNHCVSEQLRDPFPSDIYLFV